MGESAIRARIKEILSGISHIGEITTSDWDELHALLSSGRTWIISLEKVNTALLEFEEDGSTNRRITYDYLVRGIDAAIEKKHMIALMLSCVWALENDSVLQGEIGGSPLVTEIKQDFRQLAGELCYYVELRLRLYENI